MQQECPPAPHSAARLAPGDLVDEREAALILGVAVQTMRNWRWRGEGPQVRKLGKRCVRYLVADLAMFAHIVDRPTAESSLAGPERVRPEECPTPSAKAMARLRAQYLQEQTGGGP